MPFVLKSLLPFALLGTAGVVGVIAGTGTDDAPTTAAAPPTTTTTTAGPVRVEAAFTHAVLPAQTAGETFLRVALTGVEQQQQAQRVPVGLTIVVDRSGSMGSEQKMETANDAACKAIEALQPGDQFAVLSFDDGAELIARGDAAPTSVETACTAIHALTARGSTDMIAGLLAGGRAALGMVEPGRVSRLLLLSDGRPNGETGLREHAALLARQGVVTTTIGLGTNYNEDLMASIADAGVGNSWFVESRAGHTGSTTLAKIFATELSSMTEVVARNTTLEIAPRPGLELVDVVGFSAERTKSGGLIVPVGDIYSAHTTALLVRARHSAVAGGDRELVDVRLTGTAAREGTGFGSGLAVHVAFSSDHAAVERSQVATVVEEVEQFRTTEALLAANEAWNRGDQAGGDAILNAQKAKVQASAGKLGSTKLQALFSDVDTYQQQNLAVGTSGRASMNKVAKEKARDYVRSAKK